MLILLRGGTYGDKKAAIARFEENFVKMPENIRNRIVLENDEVSYNVEDLLPVCKKLSIPLVLDWHHDRYMDSILATLSYCIVGCAHPLIHHSITLLKLRPYGRNVVSV